MHAVTDADGKAIMHGGPLDGKVMSIRGKPQGATAPAPIVFAHMEKGFILYYNLRDADKPAVSSPGEVPGYHYDYSHAVPRNGRR